MKSSNIYRMVSMSRDLALALAQNGQQTGCILEKEDQTSDRQKWAVEHLPDQDDRVTLKCMANGQYLRMDERAGAYTISTGESQVWGLTHSSSRPSGTACMLRSFVHGGMYVDLVKDSQQFSACGMCRAESTSKALSLITQQWAGHSRIKGNNPNSLTGDPRSTILIAQRKKSSAGIMSTTLKRTRRRRRWPSSQGLPGLPA